MAGHIKLGKFADVTLRDYVLMDPTNIQSATANPYAARVSAGGPYSALDTFSDWTIQNWNMGVGHTDPEQGQLFSFGESRYPGYFMPPPWFRFPLTEHIIFPNADLSTSSTSQIETVTYSPTKYAASFLAPKNGDIWGAWVYISIPSGYSTTVELRTDDGTGKPSSTILKTAATLSLQTRPIPHWHFASFGTQTFTAGTRYHIVVSTNLPAAEPNTGNYPYMPNGSIVSGEKCHTSADGTTWSTTTKGFFFLMAYDYYYNIVGIFPTASSQYIWINDALTKVVAGALVNKLTPATIYDCMQDGDYIYVAYGTGYYRYNTATDTYDTYAATPARKFLVHGGYLWKATDTTIQYTADEVYWTDVGGVGDTITGMSGLGESLYFSTQKGLFMVAPGDVIVQAAVWPEISSGNGAGMVSWEGAMYIPLEGGTIMRYDSSGAMINVGINAKEELPSDLRGTVTALCPSNYFLFAHVRGTTGSGTRSSLWSYNVDGWHCLGIGPDNILRGGAIAIDKTNGYLYWGMDRAFLHRTLYPSDINNPARNTTEREFAPYGWIEYDKFFGGYRSLDKDFDRIYIDAMDTIPQVNFYWDAEGFTYSQLMYLGRFTIGGQQEIQFPAAYRPTGKYFRLGIRLNRRNYAGTRTQVLRGIAVKYSTNVADRWRWVLPIEVSGNQQMPDGSINTYTMAQQKAHLEELIAETAPLQFTDIDGTAYTVKVTGASRNLLRYDWKEGSAAASVQWAYTLTLEEIS